ncbi:ATP-binding protein [Psychroserpens luteus]|uniref:ATP-binding protein n=1 Tax=Psychroserpens luteus TaxID=1434066 RepID=A0ABW5ZS28_9FLAO|nr:ATP-binding protein [Psychroserpens luteus]
MHIEKILRETINVDNIEVVENKKENPKGKSPPKMEWTFENVYNAIISTFKTQTNKKFIVDSDNINKVKTLAYYLVQDNRFFISPLLSKDLNSPSFKKGLILVGDYGVGKTALLKTIPIITDNYFSYNLTVDLVSEYESLTLSDKSMFVEKHKSGRRIYDDLGTEKKASNYGFVNLIKVVLESRYDANSLTILACNYDERNPLNLEAALDKLGMLYGGRVLDRVYEMFNIIEFSGKSMRR